jgi:CelD/BcsL family acetyltransferase involved in cellulose biosynthesis
MFQRLGGNAGLFWQSLQYSVSPVMVVKEPGSIFDIVKTSKQFRYSYSKLKKQPDTFFEIFTGDEYLETWADEFCQLHIQRWANTTTPSVYRDKARQVFLLECLKAWNKDEILVRFSVQMSHKRIGLSICLREKNSLIRHSSTYNPEYKKFSPGVALIYAVSEWMTKQHIRLLDFGYGNEEYKYYLANQEQVLSRIFISAKTNLLFIAKAMIIGAVKKNNRLYKFYKQRVKIYFNKN